MVKTWFDCKSSVVKTLQILYVTLKLALECCIIFSEMHINLSIMNIWNVVGSSCGSANFEPGDGICQFQYLRIKHSDTEEKCIYLPREIIMSGRGDNEVVSIPSLLELAMREVHTHTKLTVSTIKMYYILVYLSYIFYKAPYTRNALKCCTQIPWS